MEENIEKLDPRDHRVLGKQLGLFTFSDTVGKGLPLWTAKGAVIRRELERFIVDLEEKWGYQHVYTPDIGKIDLYKKSGHYPYYKDTMYAPIKIDEEEFMLRPMTCPHHFELYLSQPHSYRELPIRIAELAKLYRYELSGVLSGLTRVRSFCLADAHIICADETQAKEEISKALDLIEHVSELLGLKMGTDYSYRLSLGDRTNTKKYYDNPKAWDMAEDILRQVLKERDCQFREAADEAAFYGPKIDIQMKNMTGKEETAFTVQYDFVMPGRFHLQYMDDKGELKQPLVVHRSSIGALERIIAFLLERYAGKLPLWLAPVQVAILPVSEKYSKYAQKIEAALKLALIRCDLDNSSESLSKKIRQAETQKISYILVVGEKEQKSKVVAVRGEAETTKLTSLIKTLQQKIAQKALA